MSFTDKKLEIAIAGFALLMIGGMGYLLKSPVQSVMNEVEVIYEMPRPKSILAALFDLGDREISRDYKNPFAKKKEEAKKVDAKTAANQPAAKPVAKKKADSKAPTPLDKPSVEVNVVGADQERANLGEDISVGNGSGKNQNVQNTSDNNKKTAEEKTAGLSGDQWRALLQAQPTKENIAKLVVAYSNKEVDDQTFYVIVTDLLRNNKAETQALGLMALKGTYSTKSFAVAAQYFDQLAPEVQTQAHSYMLSYAVAGRLGYLMSALQSNNADLVATTAQVVMEGYQAAKAGTPLSEDPRGIRGDVVVNSIDGYAKFIPIFKQLAQSQDGEIAGLASAALSQIQTSVAAL